MYNSTSQIIKDINAWYRKSRGDTRALAGEIKENLVYLDMVTEDNVDMDEVIPSLSVVTYKRLRDEGYNFNSLKAKKIPGYKDLQGSDLEAWQGKTTGELVESIYDKLIDLKIRYPKLKNSAKYRWGVRAKNILKRIHLLLRHLRG